MSSLSYFWEQVESWEGEVTESWAFDWPDVGAGSMDRVFSKFEMQPTDTSASNGPLKSHYLSWEGTAQCVETESTSYSGTRTETKQVAVEIRVHTVSDKARGYVMIDGSPIIMNDSCDWDPLNGGQWAWADLPTPADGATTVAFTNQFERQTGPEDYSQWTVDLSAHRQTPWVNHDLDERSHSPQST